MEVPKRRRWKVPSVGELQVQEEAILAELTQPDELLLAAHAPHNGLFEVAGGSECCRLGERFEPTSPRTKEKNTRRSDQKGNTGKDTEDHSAAGPAIEAACESLSLSQRMGKNIIKKVLRTICQASHCADVPRPNGTVLSGALAAWDVAVGVCADAVARFPRAVGIRGAPRVRIPFGKALPTRPHTSKHAPRAAAGHQLRPASRRKRCLGNPSGPSNHYADSQRPPQKKPFLFLLLLHFLLLLLLLLLHNPARTPAGAPCSHSCFALRIISVCCARDSHPTSSAGRSVPKSRPATTPATHNSNNHMIDKCRHLFAAALRTVTTDYRCCFSSLCCFRALVC